jgi:catechol 2,3-dioxygenase-like lactoylglutathione lyase family enzyme
VESSIETIDAVTLIVSDMRRSVAFYESLGFVISYGGPDAGFTSFALGTGFLNVMSGQPGPADPLRARIIFHVQDVDDLHARSLAAGHRPEAAPRNAEWGERYFHLRDPDGHELSFARVLQ